jgi:ParB/RepB/Spo0J family partition protein
MRATFTPDERTHMPVATPDTGTLQIRLDRLFVPDTNVREIDDEWVEALRRSIRARGRVLEPVAVSAPDPSVHGDAFDYVLIAGFHRERAARLEGLEVIPGFYGDPEEEDTDRALENIMKKRLNPYQEAKAVSAMLSRGKTVAGVAELLSWDQRRVTARVKLLELPERAQQLVGDGTITLSAVEGMRAIAHVNPALLEVALDFVLENADELEPDDLASRPLDLLVCAVENCERDDVFLAPLTEVPVRVDWLQLDEQTLTLVDEATKLNHQLLGMSFPAQFRFGEAEVDRARATGVLLEYGDETPLVADFALYQELCATAITHGVQALRERISEREQETAALSDEQPDAPAGTQQPPQPDELSELERKHRGAMRTFAASAHAANPALGDSLRGGLAVVDPSEIKVARFFVYALLGADTSNSYNLDNPVSAIALRGIRLVIGDFREDVTKTKQDGSPGALRIAYGDGRDHHEQAHWLWKYLDGARTAGELYGRALVVIAAEHYASRLVLPASQQHQPLRWYSHKETAVKALEKLAGPHISPTLKALERAIAKAKEEYDADRSRIIKQREDTSEAEHPPVEAPSALDQDGPDASDEPAPTLECELALDVPLAAGADELDNVSGSSAEPPTEAAGTDASSGEAASVDHPVAIASAGGTVGPVPDGTESCVIDASEEIDF